MKRWTEWLKTQFYKTTQHAIPKAEYIQEKEWGQQENA